MRKLLILLLAIPATFANGSYIDNYITPGKDISYQTRALWHFNEYTTVLNAAVFLDDDANNPGRDADMGLIDGTSIITTGGSGGPRLVDPVTEGIGYPNGNSSFGKCVYFDGSNDWVRTDMSKVPIEPNNFQIGGWVKLPASFEPNLAPTSPAKVMMLFERYGQVAIRVVDNTGSGGMIIQPMFWNADNTFLGWKTVTYTTIGVDFHQWHHIAVEVKGNIAKCYVNGIVRGTWTLTTNGVYTSAQPYTRIGMSYNTSAPYPFKGYVDEWYIDSSRKLPWDKLCGAMGYSIGDLDGNCFVNLADVRLFALDWLGSGSNNSDLDSDSSVKFNDMSMLAGDFGVNTDPMAAGAAERKFFGYSYNYPNIDIRNEGGSTMVYWGNELIVELRDSRRLRFRATPADDHWVGTQNTPMDLCWAYADTGVNDYAAQGVTFSNTQQNGQFTINITATKPSVSGTVTIAFEGYWNPKTKKFHYLLSSRIQCPLENWYLHSNTAKDTYNLDPSSKPKIEAVDYHIEHISWPDVLRSDWPDHEVLYEWQVFSQDGKKWSLLPKIYLPFTVRSGTYMNGSGNLAEGCYFGSIDLQDGGWMSQIVEAPSAVLFGPCWMYFDVHVYLMSGVPVRYSQQNLDLTCKQHFVTVEPDEVGTIMANSQEVSWRNLPAYQLPIFSRSNTFDQLVVDPGNTNKYMWWASSYDCSRVINAGFDDTYSVSINHGTNDKSDAWYVRCWGYPYDPERVNGTYRVRAKVKTSNCTGSIVRMAIAQGNEDWVYETGFDRNAASWTYSTIQLSGTNDWTDMEVTASVNQSIKNVVLEHMGPGQSWFDNVVIEKIN